MYTTLNQIRNHEPCSEGWAKLLHYLGKAKPDDELVAIETILISNGLDDALWCLRSLTGYEKVVRLLAVSFAREVSHLMTDPRSLAALNTAEAFANGQASVQDLDAARLAAYAVAHEASSLSAVASCAAYTVVSCVAYAAAYTTLEVAGDEPAYAVALEVSTAAGDEAALAAAAFANNGHYAVRAPAIAAAKDRQRNLLLKALKASK